MTAIECLEEELKKNLKKIILDGDSDLIENIFNQAKEMERLGNNPQTFEQAVKPLMKWLCENTHPHTTAIVTGNLSELVEGIEMVKTDDFIVD
jgi:hypothetical protein